jgi:hypothetical protein
MTDLRLSARELEDVLAGRQPDGRADLAPLAEVTAMLHASREVEPAPPISDSLRAQIDGGVTRQAAANSAVRRRRHRPRHMQAATPSDSPAATYRRPLVSLAAAAVLLVGLVLVTSRGHLPGDVHSAVADMGSAIGLDLFRSDDAAPAEDPPPTTTSSTTTTTAPATTAPPPATTAPPTTQAPAGPPPETAQLPWWLQPEVWQQFGFGQWSGDGQWGDPDGNHGRDGDRDGDGDGTGAGSGSGNDRDGMTRPDGDPDGTTGTTMPATTVAPTSTSISPPSTTTGSTATTQ